MREHRGRTTRRPPRRRWPRSTHRDAPPDGYIAPDDALHGRDAVESRPDRECATRTRHRRGRCAPIRSGSPGHRRGSSSGPSDDRGDGCTPARRSACDATKSLAGRRAADVATGACSVLEHGYEERSSRLKAARVRTPAPCDSDLGGSSSRVDYETPGPEPDGCLFHDSQPSDDRTSTATWMRRYGGRTTIRLGYGKSSTGRASLRSGWAPAPAARMAGVSHSMRVRMRVGGA